MNGLSMNFLRQMSMVSVESVVEASFALLSCEGFELRASVLNVEVFCIQFSDPKFPALQVQSQAVLRAAQRAANCEGKCLAVKDVSTCPCMFCLLLSCFSCSIFAASLQSPLGIILPFSLFSDQS